MGRTKKTEPSTSGESESLPKWAEDEIKSVQFKDPEILARTGYILDIYEKDFKVDIQIYEPLPDGRSIIEGLDVPKTLKIAEFMKGFVYEFKIKMFKGPLSAKLVELLKTKFSLDMSAIFRFELQELQMMDVESDLPAPSSSSDDEGDD